MYKYKSILNLSKRSRRRREQRISSINIPRPLTLISPIINDDEAVENIALDSDKESVLSDLDDEGSDNKENIVDFLKSWTFKHRINRSALNDLLVFLKSDGYQQLPIDSRTLLKTPKTRDVINVEPGKYVHIGIQSGINGILHHLNHIPKEISLDINIDGVPISRSSSSSFWLILGKIYELKDSQIFVIGIYHGFNKPNNFNDFMPPFVDEPKLLMNNYVFKEDLVKINLRAFICDARSAVVGSKAHCSRFGCGRCTQEGVFLKNRMTFQRNDSMLRTNHSFRNRCDEDYHNFKSTIEELDIDIINQFPLDYLHTVCLGVMKKLLRMMVSGDTSSILPSFTIKQISEKINIISSTQPPELQRKIRPLSELGHFKGLNFVRSCST